MGKTLDELIAEWLEAYPEDREDPDLIFNVKAGMIELKNGTYIAEKYYEYHLKGGSNETNIRD